LHVVAVEHDVATAVATAEFDFLLHFTRTDPVDVLREAHDPSAAARRGRRQSSPNSSQPVSRAPISAHNYDASRRVRRNWATDSAIGARHPVRVAQRHRASHIE
jgi:hypothetical protein